MTASSQRVAARRVDVLGAGLAAEVREVVVDHPVLRAAAAALDGASDLTTPHAHQILHLARGAAVLHGPGADTPVSSGDVICVPAGSEVSLDPDPDTRLVVAEWPAEYAGPTRVDVQRRKELLPAFLPGREESGGALQAVIEVGPVYAGFWKAPAKEWSYRTQADNIMFFADGHMVVGMDEGTFSLEPGTLFAQGGQERADVRIVTPIDVFFVHWGDPSAMRALSALYHRADRA